MTRLALTYFAPRQVWKKKHGSKVYYLGPRGVIRSDRAAYAAALAEWKEIEQGLRADNAKSEADERRDRAIAEHGHLHISAQLLRGVMPPGIKVIVDDGNPTRERHLIQAAISASGIGDIPDFDLGSKGSNKLSITHIFFPICCRRWQRSDVSPGRKITGSGPMPHGDPRHGCLDR